MTKKQALIAILQSGDLSGSIFYQDLDQKLEIAINKGKKELQEEMDNIDAIGKSFNEDYYGLSQKNELAARWDIRLQGLRKKVQEQKKLYTKACSIIIKDNYLYLYITDLVDYNLTSQEKEELLSNETEGAEILEIAGKQHLLYQVRVAIPEEFECQSPANSKAFATWILNKLRCNALCAILMANEWKTDGQFEKV